MNPLYVSNFADLMNGQQYGEIFCLYTGKLVRKLSVAAGKVQIDATQPPIVSVDLKTPITYTPWVMDRGNLNFTCAEVPNAKICGEGDIIIFADGSKYSILPK